MICPPAIGSLAAFGSLTSTSTVTVSPGLAFTVWISHAILPFGRVVVVVGPITLIAPSLTIILSDISRPSVEEMNLSLPVIGYVPAAQSSGTL